MAFFIEPCNIRQYKEDTRFLRTMKRLRRDAKAVGLKKSETTGINLLLKSMQEKLFASRKIWDEIESPEEDCEEDFPDPVLLLCRPCIQKLEKRKVGPTEGQHGDMCDYIRECALKIYGTNEGEPMDIDEFPAPEETPVNFEVPVPPEETPVYFEVPVPPEETPVYF